MIEPALLIQVLGKSIDDPAIEGFKKELRDCEVAETHHIIYSCYTDGLELHFDDRILSTIMIYSEGAEEAEDYHEYPYSLPHSLRFSMTKVEARAALGKPSRSGSDTDIYQLSDHVLYVEFHTKAKTINSLTLMTLEKYAE